MVRIAGLDPSHDHDRWADVPVAPGRLFVVGDVIKGYQSLLARHKGEVAAEVTSATPLSQSQMTALRASLKASIGKDVTLTARVEPSILGGLIVKVGSRMVDSSIRTKLTSLENAMKEVR